MTFEARDMVVRYGRGDAPALNGVSLRVPAGCLYAVLGPNGSGKSPLLKILAGLEEPSSGTRAARRHLRIGYVPQGREIFPQLSVEENLRLGVYVRPDSDPAALEAVSANPTCAADNSPPGRSPASA